MKKFELESKKQLLLSLSALIALSAGAVACNGEGLASAVSAPTAVAAAMGVGGKEKAQNAGQPGSDQQGGKSGKNHFKKHHHPVVVPINSSGNFHGLEFTQPIGQAGGFVIYQKGQIVLQGSLPDSETSISQTSKDFLEKILAGDPAPLSWDSDGGQVTAQLMADEQLKMSGIKADPQAIAKANAQLAVDAQGLDRNEPFGIIMVPSRTTGGKASIEGQIAPGSLEIQPDMATELEMDLSANHFALYSALQASEIFVGKNVKNSEDAPESRPVTILCAQLVGGSKPDPAKAMSPAVLTDCPKEFGTIMSVSNMSAAQAAALTSKLDLTDRRAK